MIITVIISLILLLIAEKVIHIYEKMQWKDERDMLLDRVIAKSYHEYKLGRNIPDAKDVKTEKPADDDGIYDDHIGEM